MHLILSFASPVSDAGREALRGLSLPRLAALAARLPAPQVETGDELSLSPPHERALARALGLGEPADGLVPLAAIEARRRGLPRAGDDGWAWLTAAHWRLGTEQVSLVDPQALQLDDAAGSAVDAAIRELFTSEGFELHTAAPGRWLCRHASLVGLPLASLDRVIGRNVDRWLEADPRARLIRRLQNEVQMLLHGHPLNEAREARGELAVNSVWWSGSGSLPASWTPEAPAVQVDHALREPALAEDWPGWCAAWRALDAGPLDDWATRHGHDPQARLVLCGERGALSWSGGPQPALRRWMVALGVGRSDPRTWLARV